MADRKPAIATMRSTVQPQRRAFSEMITLIHSVGLRPTRQRLALAKLLFENGHRHVTADQLHSEVLATGVTVSLATVYNTVHQFVDVGLLKQVVIDPGRTYFDTNTKDHHHFYDSETGELTDIHNDEVAISLMPKTPQGMHLRNTHVIFTIDRRPAVSISDTRAGNDND
ncbi:MAG: iron response transcriptional regulator IrrA [Pseudomonadota bacterium]